MFCLFNNLINTYLFKTFPILWLVYNLGYTTSKLTKWNKEVFKENKWHFVNWLTLIILKGFGNHMLKIMRWRRKKFFITGGPPIMENSIKRFIFILLKPSLTNYCRGYGIMVQNLYAHGTWGHHLGFM